MTFIPKPDRSNVVEARDSFKPIRPAFRERQYGSEFNKWEMELLREFSRAKISETPVISGCVVFDGRLGSGRFLLVPAAHLTQDYVICECPIGLEIPANLSYVTIRGRRSAFRDYWQIIVDELSNEELKVSPRPEISFDNFQDQLFLQWGGIDSPLRELLAFEFVSSPPLLDFGQVGGLNVTMYDGTATGETKRLLKYLRSMIPLDIASGKSGFLTLPELETNQTLSPFSWRFRCFDADKPLSRRLKVFLNKRRSKHFSEISIGLGSRRSQPSSLYETPLTDVDQPVLLPDNAEMLRMNVDPPLEVTKYLITMQMMFPTIGKTKMDLTTSVECASQRIVDLVEKYDLPPLVQRHALFDPNYYGKPQSILRLALASARSSGKHTVDNGWITQVFDNYFLKNVEILMEEWPDFMTSKGVELASIKEEFDRQVLKFITDRETKDSGVGFTVLNERFPDEVKLWSALRHLCNIGKAREVTHDIFRSVPFE